MASTIVSNVGAVKGLDCQSFVGLRPSPNVRNFNCVRTTNKGSPGRFIIRASESPRDGPVRKLGRSDAECEAAVVAGDVPEAPPVPPKAAAPAGTPVVPLLVSKEIESNSSKPYGIAVEFAKMLLEIIVRINIKYVVLTFWVFFFLLSI